MSEWGLKQEQLLKSLAAEKLGSPSAKDAHEMVRADHFLNNEATAVNGGRIDASVGLTHAMGSASQLSGNGSVSKFNSGHIEEPLSEHWVGQR